MMNRFQVLFFNGFNLRPYASVLNFVLSDFLQHGGVMQRERERERDAFACIRRHQASALAPIMWGDAG